MGIKKFIKKAKHTLGLTDCGAEGKKKALKKLLKRLNERKINIKKTLETSLALEKRKELKEELEIVSHQIKKGKKILRELYS
ncbi:MAG: hypothetical protein KJO45_05240 [Sulfurovum sp.]|nr:hypothetical protein [Sulfurovum sp.]